MPTAFAVDEIEGSMLLAKLAKRFYRSRILQRVRFGSKVDTLTLCR